MQGNRSDSRVERAVRSELHRRGLRFRKHLSVIPKVRCRPDIVFTRQRLAVFIDGCFWHSCPTHGTQSKANAAWWQAKLASNVARDRRNDEMLHRAGWTVLRLWEHETIEDMVVAIETALTAAQPSRES